MDCCKSNCLWISLVSGIIAGFVLGILYTFGFVATGIIFWVYILIGVLTIFLAPIYAAACSCGSRCRCFCNYRVLLTIASIGAIVASAVGIIIVAFAPVIVTAIFLGLATLFAVMALVLILCFVSYLCID